jgi:hypothetical protein
MPPSAEGVPVTFAEGVKADIAALVTAGHPIESGDVAELGRRIAKLLVDCRANPYLGELMGSVAIPASPPAVASVSTFPAAKESRASA